ncbi:aldehyde:ferredoxin oxidoreductase [Haloplanus vescus]|uniref:Aldehyde:ferredoxin oxidoreductase n=1 Tax=Haloplanus vescus TaxID=555874 RepID=A0A1H3X609_9EURY|nr:aldehyde ferredoxin oxidoreductase C-terminal domain-containing protein [Haloplanus vescus]SDZ94703.1 aldehyde:ferredoxin oxidoreductase [Haloplanus vescus]
MSTPVRRDVIRVDLSAGRVSRERIPADWRRDFLGGKGLGARYLYDELDAGADPLGPDNRLALLLGPLSGYLPGESRFAAVTKSPLTGAFLDSYSGGSFADALAGALPDAMGLVIQGTADDPVVLTVRDGEASLSPAGDLWGADTAAVDDALDGAVACVGPAGEREVAYATIASDGGDHHAGRGGAGAVMGAKRLKAVAVHGTPPEPTGELADLQARYTDAYRDDDTGRWQAAGETVESVDFANEVGVLSTRGWQGGTFDDAADIGVEAVREASTGRENESDAVPGGFRVDTDEGEAVPRGGTLMSLGAGLGIDDFDDVARLGATCDRLGMDVISAGNAVAWAMRATDADALDTDLDFGDADAAERLLAEIAARSTALGDTLADGVEAARDRSGANAVPTVKSMELPAYDPRGAAGMALAYATSDRGGCHRRARPVEREAFARDEWSTADRVATVVGAQNVRSTLWSLVVDDFAGETMWQDLGAEWLQAVDIDHDRDSLATLGERVWTLVRLFNAREGFDRDDDSLPEVFEEPMPDGPAAGRTVDREAFEAMLDAYYDARGWSPDGLPTAVTVERLGLHSVIDDETPLGAAPAVTDESGARERDRRHDHGR